MQVQITSGTTPALDAELMSIDAIFEDGYEYTAKGSGAAHESAMAHEVRKRCGSHAKRGSAKGMGGRGNYQSRSSK